MMKKTIYLQPQTMVVCISSKMMQTGDASHQTEGLPTNPTTPGGGGLGAPARKLYV